MYMENYMNSLYLLYFIESLCSRYPLQIIIIIMYTCDLTFSYAMYHVLLVIPLTISSISTPCLSYFIFITLLTEY